MLNTCAEPLKLEVKKKEIARKKKKKEKPKPFGNDNCEKGKDYHPAK